MIIGSKCNGKSVDKSNVLQWMLYGLIGVIKLIDSFSAYDMNSYRKANAEVKHKVDGDVRCLVMNTCQMSVEEIVDDVVRREVITDIWMKTHEVI